MYSGGLLVTTSSQWVNASTERVCMSSYGLTTDVVVTVQLQQSSDNDRHRRQHHTNHAVYAQASVVLSAGRLRLMSQIQRVHFSQRIDMRDTLVP